MEEIMANWYEWQFVLQATQTVLLGILVLVLTQKEKGRK